MQYNTYIILSIALYFLSFALGLLVSIRIDTPRKLKDIIEKPPKQALDALIDELSDPEPPRIISPSKQKQRKDFEQSLEDTI